MLVLKEVVYYNINVFGENVLEHSPYKYYNAVV